MKKDKKEKVTNNEERAYFLQRLLAYFVDVIIVVTVATLISYPFTSNKSVEKLNQQSTEIMEKYTKQEIDAQTYVNQSMDNSYQISKETGLSTVITIVLYVLYFIVFQTYMEGQTIGKRFMKIKVVKNDNSELTMNDMILRNLINNFILADILIAILVLISRDAYFYGSMVVEAIQYSILIASIFMIIIRKDGRSVADFIAGTKVINLKED